MKTEKGEIYFFGPLLSVRGYGDALDLHADLIAFFSSLRPSKINAIGRTYPETTVADVRQVVALFNERAKQSDHSALGMKSVLNNWWLYVGAHASEKVLAGASLVSTFADNNRLWTHELRRLAIRLSAERDTRPKDKNLTEAVVDSATGLPGRVVDAVSGGADKASDAAESVADAASDAGSTMVDALKDAAGFARHQLPGVPSLPDPGRWIREVVADFRWPLIIGAAVLGGVVLLPQLSARRQP